MWDTNYKQILSQCFFSYTPFEDILSTFYNKTLFVCCVKVSFLLQLSYSRLQDCIATHCPFKGHGYFYITRCTGIDRQAKARLIQRSFSYFLDNTVIKTSVYNSTTALSTMNTTILYDVNNIVTYNTRDIYYFITKMFENIYLFP